MNAAACEEEGLLRDIIANPNDDWPRLVFADWLEDNGQLERAAVIRGGWRYLKPWEFWEWFHTPSLRDRFGGGAACELFDPDREGERQKITIGLKVAMPPDHWEFGFRLGFPERARLPLHDWMKYGKALAKEFPLLKVELSDVRARPVSGQAPAGVVPWVHAAFWSPPGPESQVTRSWSLPLALAAHLSAGRDEWGWHDYPSLEQADDGLSAAALLYASS